MFKSKNRAYPTFHTQVHMQTYIHWLYCFLSCFWAIGAWKQRSKRILRCSMCLWERDCLNHVAVLCVVPANWHKALAQLVVTVFGKTSPAFIWLIKLVLWRNQKYKSCWRAMLCPRQEYEHRLLPPNYSETIRYSWSSSWRQSLPCWKYTKCVCVPLRATMQDWGQLEQGNTNPTG